MDGTEIDSEDRFPWPENDYYVMQAREFVQGKVKLTFSFSGNMTLVKDSYYIYQRSALYSFPYANDDGSERSVKHTLGIRKYYLIHKNNNLAHLQSN